MTIYLIKWKEKESDKNNYAAFSSLTVAEKKLRELSKQPDVDISIDEEQGPITTHKPKNQAEVIALINSL